MQRTANYRPYIFILLFLLSLNVFAREFVHPGVSVTISDLDKMRYGVKYKMEPWYGAYLTLAADPESSFSYAVKGDPSWTEVKKTIPNAVHKHEYEADIQAAYQNALMWYITEDSRHAEKAIDIIRTWSNLTYTSGIPLSPGLYGQPIVSAAEIIKHTYDNWAAEDLKKFEDMLVYPGYSSTTVPQGSDKTFYWSCYYGDPARAGNQDASCFQTLMAIGIFLDNDTIYDRGYRYLTSQPHCEYDLPYASGPTTSGDVIAESSSIYLTAYAYGIQEQTIPDYGYNGAIEHYIYDNGQIQESSRDQTHSVLGVGLIANAAEMAWSQGDDMYSFLDNRILLGFEFSLKYVLSYNKSFPDQLTPWEPTVENGLYREQHDRTGRNLALKINPYVSTDFSAIERTNMLYMKTIETPLAHYKERMGLDPEKYLWLERSRDFAYDKLGYETGDGLEFLGWGALTSRRIKDCPGDPVINFKNKITPEYKITEFANYLGAENFDYFPMNAGGGNGRTYYRSSTEDVTNVYRPETDVNIEYSSSDQGYYLSDLQTDDWYSYTVGVPETEGYDIYVHYKADNDQGAVYLKFDGTDSTAIVTLPSTSGDWSNYLLSEDMELKSQLMAMKLCISNGEPTLKIADILVVREGTSSGVLDYLLNSRRDESTAIMDMKSENEELLILPNPTAGKFDIQLPSEISGSYHITIYDISGTEVFSIQNRETSNSVDISHLSSGVYIAKVEANNKAYLNRIIKN